MSVSGYDEIMRTVSFLHPMISQAAKETCKKKTHKTTVFKHHRAENVELLFLRQEPNHLSSTTAQAQAEGRREFPATTKKRAVSKSPKHSTYKGELREGSFTENDDGAW